MMFVRFLMIAILLVGIGTTDVWAQNPLAEDLPTRKVDKKVKENKRGNFPAAKRIRYIYVKKGKKVLYGNPCAQQVTHSMGFEYGIEHRPEPGFTPWWRRFKTNTTTKTILFFTKGPWWKSTVNKKLSQCVQSSGDRRG
ncbi:MAG: hypothetical protein ABJF11_09580 [Reichenbachiella sp.]|uniref:hypothetical protein n=1 Tax=Reichenbachiella sp. TaxID=2184521 RepID=UPI003263E527